MQKSYIKEKIDEVEKYLDEVNNKNQLNEEFEEYYLEKRQNMKNDVIRTPWYKKLSENVKGILDGSKLYEYSTKEIVEQVWWRDRYDYFEVGHTGSFSIQFPAILTQLCKIYEVEIEDKIYTKLGDSLDEVFKLSARAVITNGVLTIPENEKMEAEWKYQKSIASALEEACQDLLIALRKKIAEEHDGKFDFLKSSPNKPEEWKWDDEAVYSLVSELDEFKSNAKDMFLDEFKNNNEANDFDVQLRQPDPDLFNLLEDKNLLTYINKYKEKSLEDRKNDPLRTIFRWNRNTQNYNLNGITESKTIKQWFESLMGGTSEKDRKDIYFVLLELFGKDFEFGGGSDGAIPKARLWDKVDKKEARKWYRKNMPETDLFDNLQIEEKEEIVTGEEKTVIIEEQDYNNIDATAKENKPFMKDENFNMDIREKKNGTEKKQSKTSKTGYKIGLFLDILVTAVFVYLAITMSLYFLMALAITVPLAIFFGCKLSASCLSGSCFKFGPRKQYEENEIDTREPELKVREERDLEDNNLLSRK